MSEHFPHKLCLSSQSIQPPHPPTPKQTGRHYSTSVCPRWPHCDDDVIKQSAESWSDKWVLSLHCIGLSQPSSVWQNTATLTSCKFSLTFPWIFSCWALKLLMLICEFECLNNMQGTERLLLSWPIVYKYYSTTRCQHCYECTNGNLYYATAEPLIQLYDIEMHVCHVIRV